MNTQAQRNLAAGRPAQLRLLPGEAFRVPRRPGELLALEGRVWLTRHGDTQDHLLEAGQSFRLAGGDDVVVEPWAHGEAATLAWQPLPGQGLRLAAWPALFAAAGLTALARAAGRFAAGLREAEAGFVALARSAAASACRAQGCISAGDSMASSGAVK